MVLDMNKILKSILFMFISYFIIANSIVVYGTENTYSFSEIGVIEPDIRVINMQCIDNELVFVLDIAGRFLVFNVTNPADIIELDSIPLSFLHDIELDVDRNLVYTTASNGINIFNYTNPADLQLLSVYKNYTSSTFIQLRNELLFIGAEEYGLQIVNVTDATNPLLIGNWTDPVGDVGQVYLKDNFAFVATRTPNVSGPPTYLDLKVLNISDPRNITYVSTVDTGGSNNGGAPKAHYNDLIYFNDFAYGLKILNFTNPLDVFVAGNFSDDGFYNDVELVENNLAFIADDYFGLKVIDCSNIDNLLLTSTYEIEWRTLRVIVKDTRIYLATLNGGVRILSMGDVTFKSTLFPLWGICGMIIIPSAYQFLSKKRINKNSN